jgi:hypothetical protein
MAIHFLRCSFMALRTGTPETLQAPAFDLVEPETALFAAKSGFILVASEPPPHTFNGIALRALFRFL